MKSRKNSRKRLLQDLQRIPTFEIVESDYLGKCRDFNIRWFKQEKETTNYWQVDFGYRKTFDRWANSTDFTICLDYSTPYREDVVQCVHWMRKVIRSGLFDFNSYIGTLDCPGFMIRNEDVPLPYSVRSKR